MDIKSSAVDCYNYVSSKLVLVTSKIEGNGRKFVHLTSNALQNTNTAMASVFACNIIFFHLAFRITDLVDRLFDKLGMGDDRIGPEAEACKGIFLLNVMGGVLFCINQIFIKLFNPKMSPPLYLGTACAAYSAACLIQVYRYGRVNP